jgi:hypothetical protein
LNGAARGRALVIGAVAVALVLPGAYLAAGGSSYTPKKTEDPCKRRPWRNPESLAEIAQQISLSALDGAACRLGVSREALARALATEEGREAFSRRYGIDDAKLAQAIRAALVRAVDDAEAAGALSPLVAEPLRETLRQIPLEQAIELLRDARSALSSLQTFLGPAASFLEELLP